MSALSIGEIARGFTFENRKRSRSYHASNPTALRIWQPIASTNREARRLIAARMKAAEYYDRRHKEAGKRNGPLGHIGLEVLRELYRIVDFKTGRLEPAIATVCEAIRRSRGAVSRAMQRLREHGFLKWIRRVEPTQIEGVGPQVHQITNAYGFGMPESALAWVKKILGKGPPPECELARRQAQLDDLKHYLGQASPEQLTTFWAGDDQQMVEILQRFSSSLRSDNASSPSGQEPAPGNI